jgi:hypothetical protein
MFGLTYVFCCGIFKLSTDGCSVYDYITIRRCPGGWFGYTSSNHFGDGNRGTNEISNLVYFHGSFLPTIRALACTAPLT